LRKNLETICAKRIPRNKYEKKILIGGISLNFNLVLLMTKVTSDEFWERLLDGLITACLSGWNSGLHFKLKGGDNKILFWFQNSYLSVLFLLKK